MQARLGSFAARRGRGYVVSLVSASRRNLADRFSAHRDESMAEDDSKPAPDGAHRPVPTEERRGGPRRRVLKSGTIEFGSEAIPCTVRSVSAEGAGVEVNSPLWFPDRFVLAVDGERRPCRVVWKKERRLGLVFE